MSEDTNVVSLLGRCTKDCELKYTNSGSAVVKGSIAVNRSKKSGDEYLDVGMFFNFEFWGTRAEKLNQYLTKGTRLSISGQLRQESWDDTEIPGKKNHRIFVHVDNVTLLGSPSNNNSNNNNNDSGSTGYKQGYQGNGGNNSYNTAPTGNKQNNQNQNNQLRYNNEGYDQYGNYDPIMDQRHD